MLKISGAVLLLLGASDAVAAEGATDFGVRLVRQSSREVRLVTPTPLPTAGAPIALTSGGARSSSSLSGAVALLSRMGRVTSTYRSAQHNRLVGGVRNSHHLVGRAIDVVPQRGIRHGDIEIALLKAGYRLRESLNEGDHSHFAFDFGTSVPRATAARVAAEPTAASSWKIVYAPGARR
jgi:hypothetical protein